MENKDGNVKYTRWIELDDRKSAFERERNVRERIGIETERVADKEWMWDCERDGKSEREQETECV